MNNKYIFLTHISERKFREILKLFAADIEASKIADLTGVSRTTINRLIKVLRERILLLCEQESCFDSGSIEIDESYFGARRVRGIRGRGAKGKTIVFGLKKRNGKVYTQIVTNCSANVLIPIIKERVDQDSILYTDGFKTYDGLVNYGFQKHYRVNHGKNEFAKGTNHINGIENFWGIAKARLAKFRGLKKEHFNLHLKECEYRFNHRDENLYKLLLKECRNSPLKLS